MKHNQPETISISAALEHADPPLSTGCKAYTQQNDDGTWSARWSKPGYLDCGEWHEAETELEAVEQLLEYDSDDASLDWAHSLLEQLAEAYNESESASERETILRILCYQMPACNNGCDDLPSHGTIEQFPGVYFTGDANPIDHDGTWYNMEDWVSGGYAECVRITSASERNEHPLLWVERGNINADYVSLEELRSTYGDEAISENAKCFMDVDPHIVLDYSLSMNGIQVAQDFGGSYVDTYKVLEFGWFVDAHGTFTSERMLEHIVRQYVNALKPGVEA